MRLSGQFQASLIFFLRKDFERTKTQINQIQPTKTKKSERKTTKKKVFARTKTSKKVEIICFGFWCFLYTQNLFVRINNKQINKVARSCPDRLIYYTTIVNIITGLSYIVNCAR